MSTADSARAPRSSQDPADPGDHPRPDRDTGGDRYAIPQVSLLELVRLDSGKPAKNWRWCGAPVYRLRGNLLPLVYLNHVLKISEPADEAKMQ